MSGVELALPSWAIASPKRRAHIARVVALAMTWADEMHIDRAERDAWRDAAQWHDALRDAAEPALRAIVPHLGWPASLLHGPAAAARIAEDGERRSAVLEAVYWHTPACRLVGGASTWLTKMEPSSSAQAGVNTEPIATMATRESDWPRIRFMALTESLTVRATARQNR